MNRFAIRSSLLALAVPALSLLLTGCLGMGKSDGAVQASAMLMPGGPGGLAGFQKTVYAYARANCVECHGAGQSPLFAVSDLNSAYNAALGYVNFADLKYSLFVSKTNDGHCGAAPCTNSGNTMLALLQQWKDSYNTSSPSPGGDAVLIGNVFTNPVTVPSPNPNCLAEGILPPGTTPNGSIDQNTNACSVDGLNNQMLGTNGQPPAACTNTCWTKLRFPVSQMTPLPPNSIARAWFEVDFAYDNYTTVSGPASYVIANPRVVSLDNPVYLHDIRVFINGTYYPLYGQEYHAADLVVVPWTPPSTCSKTGGSATANAAAAAAAASNWMSGTNALNYISAIENCNLPSVPNVYSTAIKASGILQVNDPTQGPADQISFSFDYFQPGTVAPCAQQPLWLNNVYTPIKLGALQCLNCHRSGGNVTEAGMRFNMDDTDPLNCPAGAAADTSGSCYVTGCKCRQADTQQVICQKFLQRSNLANPSQSAIIVQPSQGLNGMPQQPAFGYFAPNWEAWISSEAAAARH